jgi:cadmium resistance protein CadD (predicted permease)
MNYLMALLFMGTNVAVAGALAQEAKKISPFGETTDKFRFALIVLICMLTGEFVLLANGIARLMEM